MPTAIPDFKKEFDKLATNGLIGNPNGAPGYGYIRVSSDEQGEEGRSGLPRQVQHVHEKALQEGIAISWDRLFADDYSGFELERPDLRRLRQTLRQQNRVGHVVVIEHLDRLSRNADWHQGFLLDEMRQLGVTVVFWKSFSSRIERAVMGAIAQEGMEQAFERMMQGNMNKARDGRVTARTAAYGYKLVDEHGREGERAKKFTYYAIREDEARIIRLIYERVASGWTLRSIAEELGRQGVPPPKRHRFWEGTVIRVLLLNPLYKGEFIAHRWIDVKVQKPTKDGLAMRTVTHRRARPESEWIRVQVPPIVSAELWDAATAMLAKNKRMARRNAREPFLLTGLMRCATCGTTLTGMASYTNGNGTPRKTPYRGYRCPNRNSRPKHIIEAMACDQSQIPAGVIEGAVWEVVCKTLLEPQVLLSALETDVLGEQNAQLERQIAFLEREIDQKDVEDQKLYRAYMAEVFDENEYAARRQQLKADVQRLTEELNQLYPQRVTRAQFEAQKAMLLDFATRVRALDVHLDAPFELKQRILKMTVNHIILNTRENWFQLEGAVGGTYPIDKIPVDRDSAPRSAENWPET